MRKRTAIQPMEEIALRGGMKGRVVWELKDAISGKTLMKKSGKNQVVFCGRAWGLRKLASAAMGSTDLISSLAFGTISTGGATSNSDLAGYYTYKSVGSAFTTSSTAVPYVQFTASWDSTDISGSTGFNQIGEFGLFNSTGHAGTMFARYTTGTYISATNTNQLLVTYTISN